MRNTTGDDLMPVGKEESTALAAKRQPDPPAWRRVVNRLVDRFYRRLTLPVRWLEVSLTSEEGNGVDCRTPCRVTRVVARKTPVNEEVALRRLTPEALAVITWNPDVDPPPGAIRDMGHFDVVMAHELLNDCENPRLVLRRLSTLLDPTGLFFVTLRFPLLDGPTRRFRGAPSAATDGMTHAHFNRDQFLSWCQMVGYVQGYWRVEGREGLHDVILVRPISTYPMRVVKRPWREARRGGAS